MIVVVFLLEDRQDDFFVPVLGDVVMAEDCYAEWDLVLYFFGIFRCGKQVSIL